MIFLIPVAHSLVASGDRRLVSGRTYATLLQRPLRWCTVSGRGILSRRCPGGQLLNRLDHFGSSTAESVRGLERA